MIDFEWKPCRAPNSVIRGTAQLGASVRKSLRDPGHRVEVFYQGERVGWKTGFRDSHVGRLFANDCIRILEEEGLEALQKFLDT